MHHEARFGMCSRIPAPPKMRAVLGSLFQLRSACAARLGGAQHALLSMQLECRLCCVTSNILGVLLPRLLQGGQGSATVAGH